MAMRKFLEMFQSRRFLIIALSLASMANFGCSTPAVPDTDPDPPDTAWYAYQQCIENLPHGRSESVCDNVGTTAGSSRSGYTNTTSTRGGSGPSAKASGVSDEQLAASYHDYLKTLDAQTLAELTAQWQALAESAGH